MSRRREIAFIGIYVGIILAMLFVFFFIQERYGAHLQRPQKNNAGTHSLMHRGTPQMTTPFSSGLQTISESAVPFDSSPESLVKIHLRPESETLPGPRSV